MLLQIKVYLITVLYFFGALFMVLFPPRNFEQSGAKIRKMKSLVDGLKYKKYINYDELLTITQRISRDNPEVSNLVQLKPLTAENRSIVALELHSDKHSKKPGILIVGALNAMAWGAANAVIELAEKLLYDSNYQTPFFNDYDWYLIPMGNPDGVNFTQRLRIFPPVEATEWARNATIRALSRPAIWHKNVNKTDNEEKCFGTNINRNFAYHWQDDVYKTLDVCSQYYPGPKPFSTAEAQAIRNYVDSLGDVIYLAIHLHASFIHKKEFILYPWRYSLRHPSKYHTLQDIGEYAARQSRLPDGRLYQVHQSSSDERVAGSFSDYISGVVGIDLVFLVKPYHQLYPNYSDHTDLEVYVKKAVSVILSIVRGWRSSTKQNTLSLFRKDIEF